MPPRHPHHGLNHPPPHHRRSRAVRLLPLDDLLALGDFDDEGVAEAAHEVIECSPEEWSAALYILAGFQAATERILGDLVEALEGVGVRVPLEDAPPVDERAPRPPRRRRRFMEIDQLLEIGDVDEPQILEVMHQVLDDSPEEWSAAFHFLIGFQAKNQRLLETAVAAMSTSGDALED